MKKIFHQILLVEDDTITNFINEQLLLDMQVADRIHAVGKAELALTFIRQHWLSPEKQTESESKLLLLDIRLENWDGFELLEQLPIIEHLCIVILSASTHPKDIEKAKELKVDAYLEKPLTREKLEAVADKLKQCAA